MQLSAETVQKFEREAPELLPAVDSGEAEFIMKRDPATDFCVKFDAGWCSIHRDYGPEFLGDACHFYPRVTRALNDTVVTSMALSCPEGARSMLFGDAPFAFTAREEIRTPFTLTNYLSDGNDPDAAAQAHRLHGWRHVAPAMQPVLTRYLQAQISQALFPYAGLGNSLMERVTVIAIRVATFKMALMAHVVKTGQAPTVDDAVHIAYTLSRFMDHLADATLSMAIYTETGWVREARLRALLGDA